MNADTDARPVIATPLALTVTEAAGILGLSRSSAYEAIRTGDMPAVRIGRRLIVPAAWVADQLGVELKDISL